MCFISHMVSLPFILHLNLMLAACPRNFNPHPDEFKTQHEFSLVYKQPDLQSFLGTPLLLQGLLSGYPRETSPCKSHLLAQGCRWVPMSPQGRMQHSCSFSVTGVAVEAPHSEHDALGASQDTGARCSGRGGVATAPSTPERQGELCCGPPGAEQQGSQQCCGLAEISAEEGSNDITDLKWSRPGHKHGMKLSAVVLASVWCVPPVMSLQFEFADEHCCWCIFFQEQTCYFANPHICRWPGEGEERIVLYRAS